MLSVPLQSIPDFSSFLRVSTPLAWLEIAIENIPLLLLDHAHCERKAAANAINFMSKYPGYPELVNMMSPLAREELLHFEKVLTIMAERNIAFGPLPPSNYAQQLHFLATKQNTPERLCDLLLIGAIIEARSCERFNALVPKLTSEPQLARFYATLVKAEARHFEDYLKLAHLYGKHTEKRLDYFLSVENELILGSDTVFRFHSGIPALST
ncbi:tRNA-(ms[2]io[6]A)-hydroxylase [Legionella gresilensis]|uniref:tRNA-(ms[2]io[6]A)-hydroxylase n=1 Tax=Legionella gresilensis TaxID=91823 RepID=UPI0010416162|nr:tRNA-(ms[2]io[6]A)-hydroxylase [Legionella gresilensis]